jgi:hypothetical protein
MEESKTKEVWKLQQRLRDGLRSVTICINQGRRKNDCINACRFERNGWTKFALKRGRFGSTSVKSIGSQPKGVINREEEKRVWNGMGREEGGRPWLRSGP